MRCNRYIRSFIAGIFIVLFAAYYVNATMFWHCHIINGVTIVHSHIHTKSHQSTPDGGHTEDSVTLIAAINAMLYLDQTGISGNIDVFRPLCLCMTVVATIALVLVALRPFSLRAPPVYL